MLTTGQAAKLCSVTPDAVLKWIHAGKLPASRTAGGHFRISRDDLRAFMSPRGVARAAPAAKAPLGRTFQYCWEHKGNGKPLDTCSECVVYQMRAQRCYEVIKLTPQGGHKRTFCKDTCEECDYYREVHLQDTNVLVVTDNRVLSDELETDGSQARFSLETTHCEYACSAMVGEFRPDFVVIDCGLGRERSRQICRHLADDPRVPFVRVVMAGEPQEFPGDCNHLVFATLKKPLHLDKIEELILGTWERNRQKTDSGASG